MSRVIPADSPEYLQALIDEAEARYGVTGLRGPDNRELYVIDNPQRNDDHADPMQALLKFPGAMWREPRLDADDCECWVIVLPNRAGSWWTTYNSSNGGLWQVSGEPPKLTISPSINAGDGPGFGNWHGWIKDGVMTP